MTFALVLLGLIGWAVVATVQLIARDGYRRLPDRHDEHR